MIFGAVLACVNGPALSLTAVGRRFGVPAGANGGGKWDRTTLSPQMGKVDLQISLDTSIPGDPKDGGGCTAAVSCGGVRTSGAIG
jgi:hypothetical protein